jgi:hypothetical protein
VIKAAIIAEIFKLVGYDCFLQCWLPLSPNETPKKAYSFNEA